MAVRQARERLQKRGSLRQQAVIGRQWLDDGRGNARSMAGKQRLERDLVIEWCDQRLLARSGGQAGTVRQRGLGQTRAGAHQHRIGVAVIAALELQNDRASGGGAGHAQCRHDRFGTGIDEADALHPGNAARNELRELQAIGLRGTQAPAARERALGGGAYLGVAVTENQRAEGHAEIDVLTAIHITQAGRGAPAHEARCSAYATKGTHGRVHAAG